MGCGSRSFEGFEKGSSKPIKKWLSRIPLSLNHKSYLYQFRFFSLKICLLCAIPQQELQAVCVVEEIVATIDDLSQQIVFEQKAYAAAQCIGLPFISHLSYEQSLTSSFYNLAVLIHEAEDSKQAAKKFAQGSIDRMNKRNATAVTLEQACRKVRKKIDSLSIPKEYRNYLSLGLDLMETSENLIFSTTALAISWPWQWNWFGLNKKHKRHESNRGTRASLKNERIAAIAFGVFCAAVVIVAIYSPAVLTAVVQALTMAAGLFF